MIAGLSNGSYPLLFIGIAVVTGAGIGFGYVVPLSVATKWFPERKGLITGVVVAGFGAGAILLSAIAEYVLTNGVGILQVFLWLGIISAVVLALAACLLSTPPEAGAATNGSAQVIAANAYGLAFPANGYWDILRYLRGVTHHRQLDSAGGQLAGLSEAQAALSVVAFAVRNGLGRIVWGPPFDQITYRCIPLSFWSCWG